MGIGKTFFVKGLIKTAGCDILVQSPTYNIYNEYLCHFFKIYHFDLYRIDRFINFDILNVKNCIYIFEWPDKWMNFINKPDILINIFSFNFEKYIIIKFCSNFSINCFKGVFF